MFSCRLLLVLLDSVLRGPHDASLVSDVRHPSRPDEHRHLAGLRQQRPQPHHLHHLQHGVQEVLQEMFPQLLLTPGFPRQTLKEHEAQLIQDESDRKYAVEEEVAGETCLNWVH